MDAMEITHFVVSRRENGLLSGDYGTYKTQLARRILVVRKRLNYTTAQGKKSKSWASVTAEDVSRQQEFTHLLLLTSERAWAQAMLLRSVHTVESTHQTLPSSTKRHIASRLHKAQKCAGHLAELLGSSQSKASTLSKLEAQAYHVSLRGCLAFEKQQWHRCLQNYSEARLIYGSLAPNQESHPEAVFQEILTSFVDPSLRFAAYKTKIPRTVSLETVVKRNVPPKCVEELEQVRKSYPDKFFSRPAENESPRVNGSAGAPKTIQWRSRTITLEDASTSLALATVSSAEGRLSSLLSSNEGLSPLEKAAAYDEILIASQDALDAVRIAVEELSGDGVQQNDPRMQSLQITRLALHFNLVGWRVGRNRVLCGEQDGAVLEDSHQTSMAESKSRRYRRLRECVVLYEATLQSLDSVQKLPGAVGDQAFVHELRSKYSYFKALRCLALARCHHLGDSVNSAVAMLLKAEENCSAASVSESISSDNRGPINLAITASQIEQLKRMLRNLLMEYRSQAEIGRHPSLSELQVASPHCRLSDHLSEYPSQLVDLSKLVSYPPKVKALPVKPIFLDVAYNYIDYPGHEKERSRIQQPLNGDANSGQKKEAKKGWFSFSR